MTRPGLALTRITLREGDQVDAQWWGPTDRPGIDAYVPATPVPYGRCRPGGVLLVVAATRREACQCVATHSAQAEHDHGNPLDGDG